MPGTVRSIIIGAGISAGTPATLGTFPIFSGAIPPDELVDGNIRQDASAPPKVYIGQQGVSTTATVLGGATASALSGPAVVIGESASHPVTGAARTTGSVVIGYFARTGSGAGNMSNVAIGNDAVAGGVGGNANNSVVIGASAQINSPAGGANCVCVGASSLIALGSSVVVVGSGTSYSANNGGVLIGQGSSISGGAGVASPIVIGNASSLSLTRTILLGSSLVASNGGSDSVIIGMSWTASASMPNNAVAFFNSAGYTSLIIGRGEVHASPQGLTFRLTDGLGANIGAGSLTIRPGNATGAGAQGSVDFQTQSAAGGASVLGTMTTQVQIIPCTGAAGQANLRINNVANGAGVGAGTLANAPAAGNPTFWLPVNIAGTVRYIPCW